MHMCACECVLELNSGTTQNVGLDVLKVELFKMENFSNPFCCPDKD